MVQGGINFDFDAMSGMLGYIKKVLNHEFCIEYSYNDLDDSALEYVVEQYYDHVSSYGVPTTSTDPYKFLAWIGVFLYHEIVDKHNDKRHARIVLASTIACMHRTLKEEGRDLNFMYTKKILQMVCSECDKNPKLGIGQNGLYLAFRSASQVEFS